MRLVAVTRGGEDYLSIRTRRYGREFWVFATIYTNRHLPAEKDTFKAYLVKPSVGGKGRAGPPEWENALEWLSKFPEAKLIPFLPLDDEHGIILHTGRRLIKALNCLPLKGPHGDEIQFYEVKL